MDFSLSVTNATATITAGQSATIPISLATSGASLTSAVTLTASGNPQGTTVNFSPATVAAGSASASSTLTITTTSRVASLIIPGPATAAAPAIAALFWVLAVVGAGGKKMRIGTSALRISQLLLCLAVLSACGGSGGGGSGGSASSSSINPLGTPAGSYPITVTATAGSIARTMQVTLVVN